MFGTCFDRKQCKDLSHANRTLKVFAPENGGQPDGATSPCLMCEKALTRTNALLAKKQRRDAALREADRRKGRDAHTQSLSGAGRRRSNQQQGAATIARIATGPRVQLRRATPAAARERRGVAVLSRAHHAVPGSRSQKRARARARASSMRGARRIAPWRSFDSRNVTAAGRRIWTSRESRHCRRWATPHANDARWRDCCSRCESSSARCCCRCYERHGRRW